MAVQVETFRTGDLVELVDAVPGRKARTARKRAVVVGGASCVRAVTAPAPCA
jgi:hypothetical protein